MIVTVTPTIMDGVVVRWYHTLADADHPGPLAVVSASRNGVRVNGYLDEIPDEVMATARHVHATLAKDRDADFGHLATHRRARLFGLLEPVPAREVATDGR